MLFGELVKILTLLLLLFLVLFTSLLFRLDSTLDEGLSEHFFVVGNDSIIQESKLFQMPCHIFPVELNAFDGWISFQLESAEGLHI